jgi:hypothetical protein
MEGDAGMYPHVIFVALASIVAEAWQRMPVK